MRSEVKNQINKCRKPRQGNQRQWQNGLSQTAFKNKSYKFRIKSKLLTMVYKILYDLALACHFPSPSFISSLLGQTDSSPPFHKVLFVFFCCCCFNVELLFPGFWDPISLRSQFQCPGSERDSQYKAATL